jgi:hypothetical protein
MLNYGIGVQMDVAVGQYLFSVLQEIKTDCKWAYNVDGNNQHHYVALIGEKDVIDLVFDSSYPNLIFVSSGQALDVQSLSTLRVWDHSAWIQIDVFDHERLKNKLREVICKEDGTTA